jgi:filamentous hemagglutinin family protein
MPLSFTVLPKQRMASVPRLTTALHGVALLFGAIMPLPAAAQPAASARPQGGNVVAGLAQISKTDVSTRIDQSSQRAAIDWRSFDVGSGQHVEFSQPSANSVTLNRVTSPDPSQIAGKISANGQVVLVNPAGVLFTKGAQVDAQSVIVSAAGITNQNFMAGRMVFDQPARPGAQIVNDGRITVKQTGLAALVGPQVKNSGVISAKLGHVILGGAETHTLDLYGDGLLSFDVTGQVKQAPTDTDGKTVTALVTNTGTIRANGGTVLLTASAVDGIVQNLVTAGGKISASSVGGKTGTIVLGGTGGALVVEGTLAARGRTPGTMGGQIQLASTGDITLASGARVDVSGRVGGGTVAIGTTLARAKGGPSVTPAVLARNAVIATGATVSADATERGPGGNVTVLSAQVTDHRGAVTARGGPSGGNGGAVEISGQTLGLTGTIDTGARMADAAPGTILLDPDNMTIFGSAASPNTTNTIFNQNTIKADLNTLGFVSDTFISNSTGVFTIAAKTLKILGDSDQNIHTTVPPTAALNQTLDGPAEILVAGPAKITRNDAIIFQFSGAVEVHSGASIAAPSITIDGGSVTINGSLNPAAAPTLQANNIVLQAAGGGLTLSDRSITGLNGLPNVTLSTTNSGPLTIGGPITAGTLTLNASGPTNQAGGIAAQKLTGTTGNVFFTTANIGALDSLQVKNELHIEQVGQAPALTITSNVTAGGNVFLSGGDKGIQIGTAATAGRLIATNGSTVELVATGPITELNGSITASALNAVSLNGSVQLNGPNAINSLQAGPVRGDQGSNDVVAGTFSLTNTQSLTIAKEIGGAGGVALSVMGDLTLGTTQLHGTVSSKGPINLNVSGGVTAPNGLFTTSGTLSGSAVGLADFGTNTNIGTLGAFSVTGSRFVLDNAGRLTIAGPLSAGFIHIQARDQVVLTGTIKTQGVPLALQSGPSPSDTGSSIVVRPGRSGTGQFVATRTAAIEPINTSPATLRIGVPGAGGEIDFSGLNARQVFLVLDTGAGGRSQGHIDVGGLLVLGAAGSAELLGTVGNVGGPIASAVARIQPRIDPAYTMNGCAIGVVCQMPQPWELYPPVQNLSRGLAPDHLPSLLLVAIPQMPAPLGWMSSPDIVPPNISRRDY